MRQYEFDFSTMTTGDVARMLKAAERGDVSTYLRHVHKFTVGGMLALPVGETANVLQQFGVALNAFLAAHLAPFNKLPQAEEDNVTRLLRQALGSGDADNTRP